ncbi:MAG: 30S ribosomal protein S7 [Chloroflexota bacterium]
MSRRNKPEHRIPVADARYNNVQVSEFINRVMKSGKKSTAVSLVYGAFDVIEDRAKKPGLEVFEAALKNVAPVMEVKPRRVGGATYQIPMEVPSYRRFALATRWILQAARSRSGRNFSEKLAAELMDAAGNNGSAIRKREETHKMAEANRAFSHYRM